MKLLIVDFFALLHRSRNAMMRTGRTFTTSDGRPTTGVFSFVNNLVSCIKTTEPTHCVVCYDAGGNQRKSDDSDYKANRTPKDPDFYTEARTLLDEGLYAMGIEAIGLRGYEADDCIYTLGRQAEELFDEVEILTCDNDLLACVTDKVKVLLFNSAKQQRLMGIPEVVEKWGVVPENLGFVKALSGDASDNIKGIQGVGPKTAVKILTECDFNFERVTKHPKVVNHVQQLLTNLSLIRLRDVEELSRTNFSDYELGKATIAGFDEWLQNYEFTSLIKRLTSISKVLKLRSAS